LGKEQQVAFKKLKELITLVDALAFFSVNSRRRIVADMSRVGLGAGFNPATWCEWCVIGYTSRHLSDVERRYSQTEKEALALVWTCECFIMYMSSTGNLSLKRIISLWSTSSEAFYPCGKIGPLPTGLSL